MTQKISKGLYAFITLTILLVGAFFMVKAIETKEVIKEVEKTTVLAEQWFIFNGTSNPGDANYEGDLQNPANYSPTHSSTPPTICEEGDEKVCAVKVSPSSNDPDQPDESELEQLLPEMTSEDPDTTIVRLKKND